MNIKTSKGIGTKRDLQYTTFRRGLYKKKLAPKNMCFIIVKIKENGMIYTNSYPVPTYINDNKVIEVEEALVKTIRDKYKI